MDRRSTRTLQQRCLPVRAHQLVCCVSQQQSNSVSWIRSLSRHDIELHFRLGCVAARAPLALTRVAKVERRS